VTILAHISDLHFGREEPGLADALLEDLLAAHPALVAVSGDLTQRARRSEFEAARAFLDRIAMPKVVVPGNHDLPLFDVVRRALRPLGRYQRHITADMLPFVRVADVAAMGVNTARPSAWKDGRISEAQIEGIRDRFCRVPEDVFKVLVTHHPFLPPPDDPSPPVVGRGLQGLLVAEECGVDLLVAGHLHRGYTGDVRSHHVSIRRSILVAQAGTAISRRTRGEANSYNLIRIEPPRVAVSIRAWDGRQFTALRDAAFLREGHEWRPVSE
jgi:3',5'-cyclic AMP phosphodiesterase CpdA